MAFKGNCGAETVITLAMKGEKNEEKVEECHCLVTGFVVKEGSHIFANVESPVFRFAKCLLLFT